MKITGLKKGYRNVRRLQQIIGTLFNNGFEIFVSRLNLRHLIPKKRKREKRQAKSLEERLRNVFEELGPTFIKFGQILSVRPDIVPHSLICELQKLQDSVPSFRWEEAEKIIQKESGKQISEIFTSFEKEPFAAASIAQVHKAELKSGEKVVVKIQRPNIENVIETDLSIMLYLAAGAEKYIEEAKLYNPVNIVEEFARTVRKELDFKREAKNIERFAANFRNVPSVYVPKVFWDYTTSKMLIMERVEGIKVDDIENIKKARLDTKAIARNGANAVLKQVFQDGFFHGDPHPGNISVLEGNVICFFDFGIMGKLDDQMKNDLACILVAAVKKDSGALVKRFLDMGIIDENANIYNLTRDLDDLIDAYVGLPLKRIEIKKIHREISNLIHQHQIRIPTNYALLGKALVAIEGIGRQLDPEFDFVSHLKPFIKQLVAERYSLSHILRELSEFSSQAHSLVRNFPSDASEILKKLRTGKLKIEFEHQGLENLIRTLDKVSSRIAISLIIAALIIGASRVNHPVFGTAGFILTGILGLVLIISILYSKKP
ncbi:MAG: AarF/ABC1/UbiB kinase family protein [Elusimicrobia bacterium]|nr:AarF/ABC1/UbiB kinase family protein [Elusimicrobiota bacterium]